MSGIYKKGTVVTITLPKANQLLAAVVTKSTPKDLIVATDKGDGNVVTFGAAANKRTPAQLAAGLKLQEGTSQPISAALQSTIDDANGKGPSLKRGEIVSYDMDGERCTGRVSKGGKTPMVSNKDGSFIKGPAREFTPCAAPVIESDAELADWDVSAFKEQGMGRDFQRWQATVTHKGVPVFYAICDGDGGPLRYEPVKKNGMAMVQQWEETLRKYVEAKGGSATICEELWPEYQWDLAPTGLSFIEYIKSPL